MSMFDSAYATIKCPFCGDEREREVQFKLHVGRAYSPQMQEVRVRDLVANFPPIKLVEGDGYVGFDCCEVQEYNEWDQPNIHAALVSIEYGVLASVVYPLPIGHQWAPLPRGRLWARHQAASEEEWRRRRAAWEEKHKDHIASIPPGLRGIAVSMAIPLSYPLDYAGIARRMFRTGEDHGNYWRPQPGAPWQRRPECRLF